MKDSFRPPLSSEQGLSLHVEPHHGVLQPMVDESSLFPVRVWDVCMVVRPSSVGRHMYPQQCIYWYRSSILAMGTWDQICLGVYHSLLSFYCGERWETYDTFDTIEISSSERTSINSKEDKHTGDWLPVKILHKELHRPVSTAGQPTSK